MEIGSISFLKDTRFPRLMRLNNPLGLTISNQDWTGKIPHAEKTDRSFEGF